MQRMHRAVAVFLCCLSLAACAAAQQLPPTEKWTATVAERYAIYPDVVYGTANNYALKLDVWQRKDAKTPAPTLIYYHGGGWIFGDRTGATLYFLPYLQMGWNVINVEYRMASQSPAPAAVEDCRCALRWVYRNAKQYNIDTKKIVVTGHSAGGHLSLIVGMLPDGTGLDNNCIGDEKYGDAKLGVAAIVNWYGPSDVGELLQGPELKNYAIMWMGSQVDVQTVAKRVSPLTYVRPGLPPVFTVHGDADDVVPYEQSVRLHKALSAAGVPNELVTIKGGGHGQFNDAQLEDAYTKLYAFLREHGLMQ
ncbi:alpha/beta hydrolase [Candidatus Korobacter versatilis]|nr:alpha/beta hydrolase [Candidatus Koribacter versatilis]